MIKLLFAIKNKIKYYRKVFGYNGICCISEKAIKNKKGCSFLCRKRFFKVYDYKNPCENNLPF